MRRFRGSFSGYEFNHLFLNQGNGEPFVDAAYPFGLASTDDGRAVAAFDMDGDGLQDLVVHSLQGLEVYQNRLQTENQYIQLSVLDEAGRPAIGAEVRLEHGERTILDRVRVSAGFHTQVSPRIHMGLGRILKADQVSVRWPTGDISTYTDLRQAHIIFEKSSRLVHSAHTDLARSCVADSDQKDSKQSSGSQTNKPYLWALRVNR